MNHYGRKLVKALLLGGTIVTGFALHSTNAKAAEIDEVDVPASTPEEEVQVPEEVAQAVEQVPEEVVVSEEGVQLMTETVETDSTIQTMEDAVGVIAGDAVAEEGYLQQSEDAIADESLTEETAEDIQAGGKAVLDQAAEKKEQVESAYEEVEKERDAAEREVIRSGAEGGVAEYSEAIQNETDVEKKKELVAEALQKMQENLDKLKAEIGEDSEEYKKLEKECEEARAIYEDIEWDLEHVWSEAYNHYNEDYETKEKSYSSWAGEEEYYKQYKEKLDDVSNCIQQGDYYSILCSAAYAEIWGYEDKICDLERDISFLDSDIELAKAEGNLKLKEELEKQRADKQKELAEIQVKKDETQTKYDEYSKQYKGYIQKLRDYYGETITLSNVSETYEVDILNYNEGYAKHQAQEHSSLEEYTEAKSIVEKIEERVNQLTNIITAQKDREKYSHRLMSENLRKIERQQDSLTAFTVAAKSYTSALLKVDQAKTLVDAAIAGYNKTEAAYTKLTTAIADFMTSKEADAIIKKMEDILADMDSDINKEEGYLDDAEKGIKDNSLTDEKANEIIHESEAVADQSDDKLGQVEAAYNEMVSKTEPSKNEFNQQAEANGLGEYVKAIEEAEEDYAGKIELVDEAVKKLQEKINNDIAEYIKGSDSYNKLLAEIEEIKQDIEFVSSWIEGDINYFGGAEAFMNHYNQLLEEYLNAVEELKNLNYEETYKKLEKEIAEDAAAHEKWMAELAAKPAEEKKKLDAINAEIEKYKKLLEEAQAEGAQDNVWDYSMKLSSLYAEAEKQEQVYQEAEYEYEMDLEWDWAYYSHMNDSLYALEEEKERLEDIIANNGGELDWLDEIKGNYEYLQQRIKDLEKAEAKLASADAQFAPEKEKLAAFTRAAETYKLSLQNANRALDLLVQAQEKNQKVYEIYASIFKKIKFPEQEETPNFPVGTQTFEGTFQEPIAFTMITNVNGEDQNLDVKINPDITGTISVKVEAVKTSSHSPFRPLVTIVADVVGDILVTINNVVFPLPRILNFAISFII